MKRKTKINWYDLKDREYLYLKKGVLKSLVNKGIKRTGSLSKLCIELGSTHLYTVVRERRDGISIKKLKHLLRLINKDYNFINNKILEIRKGSKHSIKDPKFPINLLNEKMGSILGHVVSDGSLYYDLSRKDLIRTRYYSPDKQLELNFVNDIGEIFGDVHFSKGSIRNCKIIGIGNSVMGETLKSAGATIGKKYKLNNQIPWIIKSGNTKIKKNYLSAIFDDEGSVGETCYPYLILSRNIHIKLTKKEENFVNEHLLLLMKTSSFPTGHITRRMPIGKLKEISKERNKFVLLKNVLRSKPKILLDESGLLNEFGINNHIYVTSFQLTSNGNYSVKSSLVIRNKKDTVRFCKIIGFKLKRKQDKLENALLNKGWINHES